MPRLALGVSVATCALLLIAVADLPYSYYTFLRSAVFVGCVVLGVVAVRCGASGWLGLLGPVAILWNPAIPVALSKEVWMPLNVIAAVLLLLCGTMLFRAGRLRNSEQSQGID